MATPAIVHRPDPYDGYRFRIKCEGVYVAAVNKASGLTRSTEIVKNRRGGDPGTTSASSGVSEYGSITLERGVTYDEAFEQWTNKVWDYENSVSVDDTSNELVSLKDFRKDLTIEMYNESGKIVTAFLFHRCWASEYTALPELSGQGSGVAIKSLKLEYESWERDTSVVNR